MTKQITLVIHGTFAADELWWRIGEDDQTPPSFADRLNQELVARGLGNTVWHPALQSATYEAFSWSGQNSHRDRIRGASKLASSLNTLADDLQASVDDPLVVNFVGHSHGGNVLLESFRKLKQTIRVGRVVLLGTPIVSSTPAFRIGRFVFSALLTAFFFIFSLYWLSQLISLAATGGFLDLSESADPSQSVEEFSAGWLMLVSAPTLAGYCWLFWGAGNLLDVVWRLLSRLSYPILWVRQKSMHHVYGPSLRKLREVLRGQPILLLTSRNDEAELILQISSAPSKLYSEFVESKLSPISRVLELLFLRPLISGVLLKAVEVFLEWVSLGFPLWRSFLIDLEVRNNYPPDLVTGKKVDVSGGVEQARRVRASSLTDRVLAEETNSLQLSLQEVSGELARQIQLRHSAYYQDTALIGQIADYIAGDESGTSPETVQQSRPRDSFWEIVLLANLAATVGLILIAKPTEQALLYGMATMYFLGGYAFPLLALAARSLISIIFKRRLPFDRWRGFWMWWVAFYLLLTPIAFLSGLE